MRNLCLGLSLLAMAGLWTGCTNDEVVETKANQAVSFRVQGSAPALRATGTTLPYVNAFVVYGTDNVLSAKSPSELIFKGVTVARQAGGGDIFDYNPKKYYGEKATKAGFFAYSPVSKFVTGEDVSNFMNGASFDYEVISPNGGTETTQEDFLVAQTGVTISSTPAPVTLNFKHALSRIFVKAENTMSETVIIDSLKLRNLNSKATLSISNAAPWKWEAWNAPIDYVYTLAKSGVSVRPKKTGDDPILVTSEEQGMMVLPQKTVNTNDDTTFDTGDFALEVTYDVANLTNQKAYILLPDNFEFVAGQQYAITITFTGNAITFTVTVTDWASIQDIP